MGGARRVKSKADKADLVSASYTHKYPNIVAITKHAEPYQIKPGI